MQLHREEPRLRARGASLYLVGIGSPAVIGAFREETGVTAPIFADRSFAAYEALRFRRGLGTFLSPRLIANAIRAFRAGHRQRGVEGDSLQQGGVLVVRQDGEVVYRYASATAGDHPRVEEILAAL